VGRRGDLADDGALQRGPLLLEELDALVEGLLFVGW
jgi:hypothetical protein